jgi:hypothetical protein
VLKNARVISPVASGEAINSTHTTNEIENIHGRDQASRAASFQVVFIVHPVTSNE